MPPVDPNTSQPLPPPAEAISSASSPLVEKPQVPQQSEPSPRRPSNPSRHSVAQDENPTSSNPSLNPPSRSKIHTSGTFAHRTSILPDQPSSDHSNNPRKRDDDPHEHDHQDQDQDQDQHDAPPSHPSLIPDQEQEPEPEPDQDTQPPRPNFTPVFTVITDAHTGEHYHPHVHYIFSDDTSDLITAASLRTLSSASPIRSPLGGASGDVGEAEGGAPTDQTYDEGIEGNNPENVEESSSVSPLPPRNPAVDERYIVLDLNGSGDGVSSAQSLSSAWAVSSAALTPAPTWDDPPVAGGSGVGGGSAGGGAGEQQGASGTGNNGGLMLKIEGTSGIDDQSLDRGEDELQDLVGLYERRLGELKRLVEAGGPGTGSGVGTGTAGPEHR
ncbi:hypothetical protein L228DRAFT_245108 [Xylona heveae TC161]|uniref:Uncharacterized protein n=1 Tax=Xylona heveae (strain CBS 132557 / TC161) TaxID=1328760 RepID=A0A165I136_XYLHT|nr:hypothetical protein L228DRAFT_245108 [Xylona heveae TC161]KZF24208.1 hypothetical protein L228DRAFT_245108 [Xylona heveae TC161]